LTWLQNWFPNEKERILKIWLPIRKDPVPFHLTFQRRRNFFSVILPSKIRLSQKRSLTSKIIEFSYLPSMNSRAILSFRIVSSQRRKIQHRMREEQMMNFSSVLWCGLWLSALAGG
jgi:hypothetical protein